jgi:uncharacterized membrane protein YciS (DUF1049 family)
MKCENSVSKNTLDQLFQLAMLHIYLLSFFIFIWVITLFIAIKLKYANERLKQQIDSHHKTLNSAVVVDNETYESASHFYETVT